MDISLLAIIIVYIFFNNLLIGNKFESITIKQSYLDNEIKELKNKIEILEKRCNT